MSHTQNIPKVLPDISHQTYLNNAPPLDSVGMTAVEMPVCIGSEGEGKFRQSAKVDAFVSLDTPHSKGIHMSRLYLLLQEHFQSELLSFKLLEKLLEKFIQSQKGISLSSSVFVRLDWPVQRTALLSGEKGWRYYPVELSATLVKEKVRLFLWAQVTYSSTCPCSAALSRQLIQEQFLKDFPSTSSVATSEVVEWLGRESSMVATPHAQRSHARFRLELARGVEEVVEFIDLVEKVLGTSVQTAVKRQDEQEFARLNASHLMFCEDAARKVQKAFNGDPRIVDYWAQMEHLESLHPHNAMSTITKGGLTL